MTDREFFRQDALTLAPALLGKMLVRRMPDGSEIDFGKAVNLKKKAARAAQIIARSRGRYDKPYALNFDFFEDGKVFLTQKSH